MRRDQISQNVGPIAAAVEELWKAVQNLSSKRTMNFGDVWEKSPFVPCFEPYALEVAFSVIVDAFMYGSGPDETDIPFAIERLAMLAKKGFGLKLHGGKDTWGTCFVSVLALAWLRLTGNDPVQLEKHFADFLECAWDAAEEVTVVGRRATDTRSFKAARRNLLESEVNWENCDVFTWLVTRSQTTWERIIETGPLSPDQKREVWLVLDRESYRPPNPMPTP